MGKNRLKSARIAVGYPIRGLGLVWSQGVDVVLRLRVRPPRENKQNQEKTNKKQTKTNLKDK